MIDAKRRVLHELLDAIAPDRLDDARAALGQLADTLLLTFLGAPQDDELLTADDVKAIGEGKSDLERGDVVTLEDVERAFLGSA